MAKTHASQIGSIEEPFAEGSQISLAMELMHAGIIVSPDTLRSLFDNPQHTKSALLAIWMAEEQGCSDWVESLPFPPEAEYAALVAWAQKCGYANAK